MCFIHIAENCGPPTLNMVLLEAINNQLLDKDQLQILIRDAHSGKNLLSLEKPGDYLVHTDVKTIRDLFIQADRTFLLDSCWIDNLNEKTLLIKSIIRLFSQIIALMYSSVLVRSSGLILNFYVRTFLLFKRLELLLSPEQFTTLRTLPFHLLIHHLPYQSRLIPMSELSTEDFEALWRYLRLVETHHSNHRT